MNRSELARIARKHGTPVVVIDHDEIRRNYASFKRHLPKVQAYYAVKANPAPEIVRTLYRAGASFDVASLPEFMLVYENVRRLSARARQDFVWDKIVYANPIKPRGDAPGPRPLPPARHLRQPGGARQDQGARAPRGRRPAPAGPEHGLDGGALLEVRLRPRRGGGPRRRGVPDRPRGGGAELPRRQPVHQLRELRPGAQHGGGRPERGAHPRPRHQDPRHRRRLSRAPTTATSSPSATSRARSTPRSPGSSRPTSRSWPSPAATWWPPPPPRSPA